MGTSNSITVSDKFTGDAVRSTSNFPINEGGEEISNWNGASPNKHGKMVPRHTVKRSALDGGENSSDLEIALNRENPLATAEPFLINQGNVMHAEGPVLKNIEIKEEEVVEQDPATNKKKDGAAGKKTAAKTPKAKKK